MIFVNVPFVALPEEACVINSKNINGEDHLFENPQGHPITAAATSQVDDVRSMIEHIAAHAVDHYSEIHATCNM